MATGAFYLAASNVIALGQVLIIAHPLAVSAEVGRSFVYNLALLDREVSEALEFIDQLVYPTFGKAAELPLNPALGPFSALTIEGFTDFPDMGAGVIPIKDFDSIREVRLDQVPDPRRTIT